MNETFFSNTPESTRAPLWIPEHIADADETLSSAPTQTPGSQCSPGGGVPCSPGGGVPSSPGWGSDHALPLSAGKTQRSLPNKRYKKGKRQRFGDKTAPLGEIPNHWRDCEHSNIDDVSDSQLAEYLIGYALEFTLPQSFWPKEKSQWVIWCSDTHKANSSDVAYGFINGSLLMVGQVIDGPNKKKIWTALKVPMSGKYSI